MVIVPTAAASVNEVIMSKFADADGGRDKAKHPCF